MSNATRPQSPVSMEGHLPKVSSSPPKASCGWPSLNPAHKKGMCVCERSRGSGGNLNLEISHIRIKCWKCKQVNVTSCSFSLSTHVLIYIRSLISASLLIQPSPHSLLQRASVRRSTAASFQTSLMGPSWARFSASPVIGWVSPNSRVVTSLHPCWPQVLDQFNQK